MVFVLWYCSEGNVVVPHQNPNFEKERCDSKCLPGSLGEAPATKFGKFQLFHQMFSDQASEDQRAACVSQTWQGAAPRSTWPPWQGEMIVSETFRIFTLCHLSSMCAAWAHILPLLDPAGVGTQINQALASLHAFKIRNT